jgi:hypothetical protein
VRALFLIQVRILLVALVWAPAMASAEPASLTRPRRAGFTFDLSAGGGFLHALDRSGATIALSLQAGGYFSPDTAINLRAVSSGEPYDDDQGNSSGMGFLGPSFQHWLTDRVFIGGGIGLYIASRGNGQVGRGENGVGVDARVGYAFRIRDWNALYVAVGGIGAHDDDETRISLAAQIGWHVF